MTERQRARAASPGRTQTAIVDAKFRADVARAQHSDERERALRLAWLTVKTLVHIDEQLTDLVALQQQQVDLLRRLLERSALS